MKLAKRKSTTGTVASHEPAFREIIGLIAAARRRAFQAVNTELIDLYWRVGQYQTALPDRKLLQRKLHEFHQLAMPKLDKPSVKKTK